MDSDYWLSLFILFTSMFFSVIKDKLTPGGAIAGGVIGWLVFIGAGFTGIAMIGLFFLSGTLATSWKTNTKEGLVAAEKNRGKRTSSQVIANGGVAGIAGLLAWRLPDHLEMFQLIIAAAFASAIADTLSGELGMVYGNRFYNILNFQQDKRGENGVVSLEGSLFGIVGSTLIAIAYSIGFGWDKQFAWIVVAGTIGNITDSILGATLEREQYMKSDSVNFINTLMAALISVVMMELF